MRSLFRPKLINQPWEDPGLYVLFSWLRRALLFDLGEERRLSASEQLRVSHIFITHTHMDHFAGFDRLLRITLGRVKELHLYGPRGFLSNMAGKLSSYSWNLLGRSALIIHAHEVGKGRMKSATFHSSRRFTRTGVGISIFDGTLVDEPFFRVKALVLDHLIPVLAFSLEEKLSVRINKQALARKGLRAGRWLSKLRKSIYLAEPDDVVLPVPTADGEGERALTLGELKRDLVTLGPGQKIVYATDFIGSKANMENLAAFAKGATVLFCEAAFLEEDRAHAVMKYHLTAKQCGQVARDAGAAAVVPFHFSPKYKARPESVAKEVMDAFLSPSS